jgi:hypothetical protein
VLSDSLAAGGLRILARFAWVLGIDPQQQHLTAALLVVPISLLVSSLLFLKGAFRRKHPAI